MKRSRLIVHMASCEDIEKILYFHQLGDEILRWATLAADEGETLSIHLLASAYWNGSFGAARDIEKAKMLCMKGVKLGCALSADLLIKVESGDEYVMFHGKMGVVCGLVKYPQLNGERVTVVKYKSSLERLSASASGRSRIMLKDGTSFLIKITNIKLDCLSDAQFAEVRELMMKEETARGAS